MRLSRLGKPPPQQQRRPALLALLPLALFGLWLLALRSSSLNFRPRGSGLRTSFIGSSREGGANSEAGHGARNGWRGALKSLSASDSHAQQLAAATDPDPHAARGGPSEQERSRARAVLRRWFPQSQRCELPWQGEYAALHAAVKDGTAPPRHLVSVAVEAGVADRLAGLITHFWVSVLSHRALHEFSYGDLPGFGTTCDAPHVDWLHPPQLPDEVVDPLKFTYKGERGFRGDRSYGPGVNASLYHPWYSVNAADPKLFGQSNMSAFPQGNPGVPYVVASSNRGRTYMLAHNPHHRPDFWRLNLPPDSLFMCGFFTLCAPNQAIVDYYSRFWQQLQEPGVLTIGIQVRTGDAVFNKGEDEASIAERRMRQAARWFECAEAVEAARALPGQKVLWYLNSDSQALRQAAKARYGDKLVTDADLAMTHPDCKFQNAQACNQAAMAQALQHSLGAVLTFSLTQFHVISSASGFGRLGAWLSGRWDHIYQIPGACDPLKPLPYAQSASHWAGV